MKNNNTKMALTEITKNVQLNNSISLLETEKCKDLVTKTYDLGSFEILKHGDAYAKDESVAYKAVYEKYGRKKCLLIFIELNNIGDGSVCVAEKEIKEARKKMGNEKIADEEKILKFLEDDDISSVDKIGISIDLLNAIDNDLIPITYATDYVLEKEVWKKFYNLLISWDLIKTLEIEDTIYFYDDSHFAHLIEESTRNSNISPREFKRQLGHRNFLKITSHGKDVTTYQCDCTLELQEKYGFNKRCYAVNKENLRNSLEITKEEEIALKEKRKANIKEEKTLKLETKEWTKYSVLSYPGGKYKMGLDIYKKCKGIERNITKVVEPFCGAASLSINIKNFEKLHGLDNEVDIYINDLNKGIYSYFSVLNSTELSKRFIDRIKTLEVVDKKEFDKAISLLKEENIEHDAIDMAYATFIKYNYSYNALGEDYVKRDISKESIQKKVISLQYVANFLQSRKVFISNEDAIKFIQKFKNDETALLFVDPPYPTSTRAKNLYTVENGSEGFHKHLLSELKDSKAKIMIFGYYNYGGWNYEDDSDFNLEILGEYNRPMANKPESHADKGLEVIWTNFLPRNNQDIKNIRIRKMEEFMASFSYQV